MNVDWIEYTDDDEYYTGSSSGGRGSEEYDGNSENEITVEKEERLRPTRDRPMNEIVVATDIRTEVEAKLKAWKEAKTYKLLNRLMIYSCIPSYYYMICVSDHKQWMFWTKIEERRGCDRRVGKEGDGEGEDRDEKAGDEAGETAGESDDADA